MPNIGTKLLGPLLLILVSILWGTSFPLIKIVVSKISAGEYVAFRFSLSIMLIIPYVFYSLLKNKARLREAVKPGVVLGLLYSGGIFLQGLGTGYTSASNSGFITSLYISIVYAIDVLRRKFNYSHKFTLALILSIIGMYLMSGGSYESRIGDLIVLAGSFFWAFQVLAVDSFSKKYFSLDLVFFQYVVAAITGFMLSSTSSNFEGLIEVLPMLLYLAAVCSILVGVLQVLGQKYTSASQAVLIYALEPVSAALFSFLIRGERLGLSESVGAALILVSVIISLWEMASRKKDNYLHYLYESEISGESHER
ncbi:MAG: DMT family transporter [Candidatus Brockarchaeota archaeon]|nr:DMT family transporter [Candidatus Brockarchaeota archaeon]